MIDKWDARIRLPRRTIVHIGRLASAVETVQVQVNKRPASANTVAPKTAKEPAVVQIEALQSMQRHGDLDMHTSHAAELSVTIALDHASSLSRKMWWLGEFDTLRYATSLLYLYIQHAELNDRLCNECG
jgi:hypothetical protein